MPEKIRILLVEDEAITAMLLKRNLELVGYEVSELVATGEAAIEAVENNHFDVVLMDIRLVGKIDGVEAATKIASQGDTPIIFMTGYSDGDIRARVKALNPAAYLVKPVTPDDIAPVIARLFAESDKDMPKR